MKPNPEDYHRLHQVLHYDPVAGVFTWKRRKGSRAATGQIITTKATQGYIKFNLDGFLFYGHRAAWFMHYGEVPIEVDHCDTNKSNNAINNLRKASRSQQGANIGMFSHNTSGFKGVSFEKRRGLWEAYYAKAGRKYFVGYFHTAEAAAQARRKAFEKIFGEFARHE
jgi:hypothetical protein